MPIFTNFYLNTIIIPNKYMYLKNHVFKEFCTTNRNLFVMKKKLSIFFTEVKYSPSPKQKRSTMGKEKLAGLNAVHCDVEKDTDKMKCLLINYMYRMKNVKK